MQSSIRIGVGVGLAAVLAGSVAAGFDVDTSPQPTRHPPITPEDGATVAINPPPMIWRMDDRAVTYTLELARDEAFSEDVIEVEGIDMPFYNHSEVLEEGTWHWRYYVIDDKGERSRPGPVRSFVVPGDAVEIPLPPTDEILANMPDHPRVFTTPDDLEDFRARRHDVAAEAWAVVRDEADRALDVEPGHPEDLVALADRVPDHPTENSNRWSEGDPTRRVPVWLVDGEAYWSPDYMHRDLGRDASRLNALSYAYLISGEQRYADAAVRWLDHLADVRLDYHIEDADERVHHDTAVYAYEEGLKIAGLSYDRLYHHLSDEQRERILDHVAYHATTAYRWLREDSRIHVRYQSSHPQQAMHALLTTVMGVATDIPEAAEWTDYLVRQYANRLAWTSEDGGYFEGHTYGHKFRWILEGLAAMRTATGIDLFQKPNVYNSGRFWLYAMSLNYWFQHGGDVYSLRWPWGHRTDPYITNLMASMTDDPYVQWWSDTVFGNPDHIPMRYVSETYLEPVPPIDIAQAKLFPLTGQLSAYNRFYDHESDRIFFRSSRWGSLSHANADQNNFVIHSGGEILAADTGYYTYSNDTYHREWSRTTHTHNSMLINREGQPGWSEEYPGEITEFLHSPVYTFFAGDASQAYGEPMERFERAILFIRPGIYVVYDELQADEPSEFSWLLNTFHQAEVDDQRHRMTVPQQHMRMQVDHVLPRYVRYSQSNERRYPVLTEDWSRINEAFPEAWHIRVSNTIHEEDVRFLTLMNTYDEQDGPAVSVEQRIDDEHTVGMRFAYEQGGEETVLFRRYMRSGEPLEHDEMTSDAMMASVANSDTGDVKRWVLAHGSTLAAHGITLLESDSAVEASGVFHPAGAAALFHVKADDNGTLQFHMPDEPSQVLIAPPNEPEAGEEADFEWSDGRLSIDWQGGEGVVWVDPVMDPRDELPELVLEVEDSAGRYEIPLEIRMAEDGGWVAFGELDVREQGDYALTTEDADVELLIQDRWDIRQSARGYGEVEGPLRDKTEVFVHLAPGESLPVVRAEMRYSYEGQIINYLRNGDFEEGLPEYPPRGWTVLRRSGDSDPGWPGWSQEDSVVGESSMKIVRPHARIGTRSQPMRLSTAGTYVLRFYARGNASDATIRVSGPRGTGDTFDIEPSDAWQEHRFELDMAKGYTEIHINLEEGGEPHQVLWLDDMEFGPIGQGPQSP